MSESAGRERISSERLENLSRMAKVAGLPWHLVGKPWMDDDRCDTYAISGHTDPHVGKPVLQWCEVDEVSTLAEEDADQKWAEAEAEQRFYLAFAVESANEMPSLVAALRDARRERDEARETIKRLNRRCQEAEAGVAEKLKQDPDGTNAKSLGRRLVGAAASQYKRERDEARERAKRLLKAAEHWSVCDCPDEVDFRCDGCNEAREAVAAARAALGEEKK